MSRAYSGPQDTVTDLTPLVTALYQVLGAGDFQENALREIGYSLAGFEYHTGNPTPAVLALQSIAAGLESIAQAIRETHGKA